MLITVSEVDHPAKILIDGKNYAATLKEVTEIKQQELIEIPQEFSTSHHNEPPQLVAPPDYGELVKNKTLVVQLNGTLIFGEISGARSEHYPNPQGLKIKYPSELPFTGISLDAKKAADHCDDNQPYNAIAVDKNLSPVDTKIDLGLTGPCFILKPLAVKIIRRRQ